MIEKIIAICMVSLILSLSVPTARAFSLDDISQPIGLFAGDGIHIIKLMFMGTQAWFSLYIMGNSSYHSYMVSKMEEMGAFHSLNRQRAIDPTCCKNSECILNPEEVCTTICVPCGEVEQELHQHFSGVFDE